MTLLKCYGSSPMFLMSLSPFDLSFSVLIACKTHSSVSSLGCLYAYQQVSDTISTPSFAPSFSTGVTLFQNCLYSFCTCCPLILPLCFHCFSSSPFTCCPISFSLSFWNALRTFRAISMIPNCCF